jgi:hypothetical protein
MMQGSPRSSRRKDDFGQRLSDAIVDNPIPAALVGMGVLWLFMGGDRTTLARIRDDNPANRTGDGTSFAAKAGSRLADTGKKTGEALLEAGSSAASTVSETAAELTSGATEAVTEAASAAQRSGTQLASSLQRDLSDFFERQPLAVGALGLIMGAAIGSAFSTTQVEAETFGEASQALKKEAQDLMSAGLDTADQAATSEPLRSGAQKVAAVAESTLQAVQDQVRSKQPK